ncbi:hypothetical protein MLD52_17780 [Puniceicoccaceae bacterium K14]|nr:hypothetical protein [Puniceicoccaceae bacterium K14]
MISENEEKSLQANLISAINAANAVIAIIMIKGMDAETIRRYAETRKKVDENADLIICISSVFSVFEEWPDDRITISPFALGKLNDLMALYSCRILSALEDFTSAKDAEDFIEKLEETQESEDS